MKKTVFIECSVSVEVDESRLTKELMDDYEKCIRDLSKDPKFAIFQTQLEKHIANITWHILRGDEDYVEGYGYLSHLVTKQSVQLGNFDAMWDE